METFHWGSGKWFLRILKCSFKNCSLKDSLGNQHFFFYVIAVKPPFWDRYLKSVKQMWKRYLVLAQELPRLGGELDDTFRPGTWVWRLASEWPNTPAYEWWWANNQWLIEEKKSWVNERRTSILFSSFCQASSVVVRPPSEQSKRASSLSNTTSRTCTLRWMQTWWSISNWEMEESLKYEGLLRRLANPSALKQWAEMRERTLHTTTSIQRVGRHSGFFIHSFIVKDLDW